MSSVPNPKGTPLFLIHDRGIWISKTLDEKFDKEFFRVQFAAVLNELEKWGKFSIALFSHVDVHQKDMRSLVNAMVSFELEEMEGQFFKVMKICDNPSQLNVKFVSTLLRYSEETHVFDTSTLEQHILQDAQFCHDFSIVDK